MFSHTGGVICFGRSFSTAEDLKAHLARLSVVAKVCDETVQFSSWALVLPCEVRGSRYINVLTSESL